MLAENRPLKISIPHTSTCIIRTSGDVQDGDTVSVVSPVFSSADFQTGSIVMTETFDVPIRILNVEKRLTLTGASEATLVCDDNDIFNMYVRVY